MKLRTSKRFFVPPLNPRCILVSFRRCLQMRLKPQVFHVLLPKHKHAPCASKGPGELKHPRNQLLMQSFGSFLYPAHHSCRRVFAVGLYHPLVFALARALVHAYVSSCKPCVRFMPHELTVGSLQACTTAMVEVTAAEAMIKAHRRKWRAQQRWVVVAKTAQVAEAEGRWVPPLRRPLTELQKVIRDANHLAKEVQVRVREGVHENE